ncbi:MAG: hypothetical protein R3F43_01025 [bacterium]
MRLGCSSTGGKQDLIVLVLNPDSRFEVANYKNVFIPRTWRSWTKSARTSGFAELFDATLAKEDGGAVVTEYFGRPGPVIPAPCCPLRSQQPAHPRRHVLGRRRRATPPRRPTAASPSSAARRRGADACAADQKSLSEDLVFVPAGPVVGGRGSEGIGHADGPAPSWPTPSTTSRGATSSATHYWASDVKCDAPPVGAPAGAAARGRGQLHRKRHRSGNAKPRRRQRGRPGSTCPSSACPGTATPSARRSDDCDLSSWPPSPSPSRPPPWPFCGFFVSGADAKLDQQRLPRWCSCARAGAVIDVEHLPGPTELRHEWCHVRVVAPKEMVKTLPHDVFDKGGPALSPPPRGALGAGSLRRRARRRRKRA